MDIRPTVAVRTRYQARPGRRVIVVTDLADLRGPAHGTVTLPLWLYWSGASPAFDLDEPFMRRWLYEIVLREAGSAEDLTSYLDAKTLIALWPELYLPRGVRQAWEELHPALRAAILAAPASGSCRAGTCSCCAGVCRQAGPAAVCFWCRPGRVTSSP